MLTVDGTDVEDVQPIPATPSAQPHVKLRLSAAGGDRMARLTRNNLRKEGLKPKLAVVLDGQVLMAPTIAAEIRRDVWLSGQFNPQHLDHLAAVFLAASLPVPMKPLPVKEIVIDPKPH